jgi:hypothetical protein
MTASEKRSSVVKKYGEILGRNLYSQPRRDYCYKKYSNGKYYSDCSSSISYAYKEAGFSFGILNTVGMYQSKEMVDVPVTIKNGIIQNPEVLRPGDMLLFAGTDTSRAYAGYVGHVEMVAKVSGKTVTLYGHGSGTPRSTEMNAYCKSRQIKKTSTKLGHKGLIRVRRFIQDDTPEIPEPIAKPKSESGYVVKVTGNTVNIRTGPGTQYTAIETVKKGDVLEVPKADGWTPIKFGGHTYWVSDKYTELVKEG